MRQLINKFRNENHITQGLIACISLALYFLSSHFLEKSYIQSKFPVNYFEQQTSFDAVKMKEWYAFMIQEGTFDIYLRTQFIDFAFIAMVILAGYTVWALIANLHPHGNFFNKWGQRLAFALPLAGGFDILENLVSFFMIANPENFADALLLPYSSFAVLKFACWTIGLIWLLASVIALPVTRYLLSKKMVVAGLFLVGLTTIGFSQTQETKKSPDQLIYIEVDPLAYINKGYSLHLGYENWGLRFDLTKVKVDFPESFEDAFYKTKAFDLVTKISGVKVDYVGNESKGIFVGVDINYQALNFTHRETLLNKNMNAFNVGLRAGYKVNIFKGFYITPWAAVWKNVANNESFTTEADSISTLDWDWITTIHLGYAIKI